MKEDCQMAWAIEEDDDQDHIRLLTLLYKLTDGKTGVSIDEDLLMLEASRIGLFSMSSDEFAAWHSKVIKEVEQKKN